MLTDFFWYPDLQYKDCHVHVGFHLNHIHFFLPIVYMWWAQVQSCLLPFPKDHQPLTCCLQYIIISTCFINNLKTLPLLGPTAALVSYLIFTYNNVLYVILTNHTTIFYKNLFWSFTLQSTSFNNQTTSSLTTHTKVVQASQSSLTGQRCKEKKTCNKGQFTLHKIVCFAKKSVNAKPFSMQTICLTRQSFHKCQKTSKIPSTSFGGQQFFVTQENLLFLPRYPSTGHHIS